MRASPASVGAFAAAAGAAAIWAYDACAAGRLGTHEEANCPCWVAGAGGLVLGILVAALLAAIRRLSLPIIARLAAVLGRRLALSAGPVRAHVRFDQLAVLFVIAPLARHAGTRAPPLSSSPI
jgi:uncharacterized protein YacL